jgi:hypothetical protein
MVFPAPLATPINNHQPALARLTSTNGERGLRSRRIFVITQVRRLPSTNRVDKEIRRVLIFDNHPDSLRLVLGRRSHSHANSFDPQPMTSSEIGLLCFLVVTLMVAMFWPLF